MLYPALQTAAKNVRQFIGVETNHTSHKERLLSGITTFFAIVCVAFVTQWTLPHSFHVLLFASTAASAFLVFTLPHGALSQPWPVFAGQMLAVLVGIMASRWISSAMLSVAIAVGATVILMHYLRCIHPPGGATAFYFASQVSLQYQSEEVLAFMLNIIVILALALVINNVFKWRRYPVYWLKKTSSDEQPASAVKTKDFELEDLHHVLQQQDVFVDVSMSELSGFYDQASAYYAERKKMPVGKTKTTPANRN